MKAWRAHIGRYGRTRFPGELWARSTFVVLFLVALVLRFWDYFAIPYTHDELSALVRIFPTLFETVKRGVIELDTHPPGVQVFEWLWTKLFGMEEWVVKLPFTILASIALFHLYRTAISWTGAGAALLLIALMATIQYSVMYAQIARPYAIGLFTTALLADQLTRYLAFGRFRNLRGILIAAVLSAYVHHFALMLAALMVITGFFLIERERRRNYLFMCGIGILLYLPNLPIFLKQLSIGGLSEWLAPPDEHWLADHALFISHWSPLFAAMLGFLVLLSIGLVISKGVVNRKSVMPLLIWGCVPLIVGLLYSIYRAPVIQHSTVLFSFPYLALVLLIGLSRLSRNVTIALVVIVSSVSIFTLIDDRKHYEVFYRSKYEAIIEQGLAELKEHGQDDAEVLIDGPDEVIRFYMDQWKIDPIEFPYVQLRGTMSPGHLERRLGTLIGKRIVYGQTNGAPAEQLARIQQSFPHMISRDDLAEGQVFRFSDRPVEDAVIDRELIAFATPIEKQGGWQIDPHMALINDGDSVPAWNFDQREFGLAIEFGTDTVVQHPMDQFEVIAYLRVSPPAREAAVSVQLFDGDSSVFYRDGRLDQMLTTEGKVTLIAAASPYDAGLRDAAIRLKTYIYNIGRGPIVVERMEVWLRRANPMQYALYMPIYDGSVVTQEDHPVLLDR